MTRWITVEALTFPHSPMTMVTDQDKIKEFRSLPRTLPAGTIALLEELHSSAKPSDPPAERIHGATRTLAWTVFGPDSTPQGFTLWIGDSGSEPRGRPLAAAYVWELDRYGMRPTPDCAAMSGSPFQEFCPIADFYSNGAYFDQHDAFYQYLGMTGRPNIGDTFIAPTSVYHRTSGDIMPWVMAFRVSGPKTINGLLVDLTPTGRVPDLPPPEQAGAISALEAAESYLAVVAFTPSSTADDGAEMVLARWVTAPPPWARYDHALGAESSYLHRADRHRLASDWIHGRSITGDQTVRLAGRAGGWIESAVHLREHIGAQGIPIRGLYVMQLLGHR